MLCYRNAAIGGSAHVKTAYFIRHLKQTRQESRNDTDNLNPPSGRDRPNDVIQLLSRPGSFHLMDGPSTRGASLLIFKNNSIYKFGLFVYIADGPWDLTYLT